MGWEIRKGALLLFEKVGVRWREVEVTVEIHISTGIDKVTFTMYWI